MDPSYFSYSMSSPPFVETWGQGLVVLHNPNAKNPLPLGYFPDAVEGFMRDGKFHAEFAGWHPISSMSLVGYHEGGHADAYKEPFVLVEAIPKEQFEYLFGYRTLETNPILTEQGWFADHTGSFLGVLTQDKIDHDWGFVVLGRNSEFEFNAIELELEFATRDEARIQMQSKISSLLNKGKRIFDAE